MLKEQAKPTAIPHKDFAKRFQEVCDGHPLVPEFTQGRLRWIRDELESKFGVNVSRESVRKWYIGETLPRVNRIQNLAQLLGVDYGWLAFGKRPELDMKARPKRYLAESGATNAVIGFIQLSGGYCALPEENDPNVFVDIYAIVKGRQRSLAVCLAKEDADGLRFSIPLGYEKCVVIGVVLKGVGNIEMFIIPSRIISEDGVLTGPSIDLTVDHKGKGLRANSGPISPITDLLEDLGRAVD